MKLNNKGFAISSVMYIILVMGVILIALTLSIMGSRKLMIDKVKDEALDNIYNELSTLYQEVEYIETTGTQWIDTGMKGTLETSYEIIFSSNNISQNGIVFGARSSATSNNISTILNVDNILNDFGNYNVTRNTLSSSVANRKYRAYNSKSTRYIYDYYTEQTGISMESYTSDFITPCNIFALFGDLCAQIVHKMCTQKITPPESGGIGHQ